jgi:predicted small secreted protein
MKRLVAMVIVVLALAGVLLTGCAGNSGGYKDSFWYKSLDTNHDGVVSPEEEKASHSWGI